MKIEVTTRFNPGQTALKFNSTSMKLEEFTVSSISVSVSENNTDEISISYFDKNNKYAQESSLFESKEDFIDHLQL